MASRAAQRSGRAPVERKPLLVRFTFAEGDVEEVPLDLSTFTFRENHLVDSTFARLREFDGDRVVLEPASGLRLLARAWVVLRRTRAVSWDDVLDLPDSAVQVIADGKVVDASPEA